MSKFKVLESSQHFLSLLLEIDINRQPNHNLLEKLPNKFIKSRPVFLIFVLLFSIQLSCYVKIFHSFDDFSTKLVAALAFITVYQAIAIFLNIVFDMPQIADLYQTFQTIVDGEGNLTA